MAFLWPLSSTDLDSETLTATPPFRPSLLAPSYLRAVHTHHEYVAHTQNTLRFQHEAVRIACSSLDLNVLAIADAFESISGGARRELAKQAGLLAGLEADLEIIGRVSIHVEFMSPAVRRAIEAGEKHRTLGDYVSHVKMKQVADTCARTHGAAASPTLELSLMILGQATYRLDSHKRRGRWRGSQKGPMLSELRSRMWRTWRSRSVQLGAELLAAY